MAKPSETLIKFRKAVEAGEIAFVDEFLESAGAYFAKTDINDGLPEILKLAVENFNTERPQQFMKPFIIIHRRLLTVHNMLDNIEIMEDLLMKSKLVTAETLNTSRNLIYAYLWNYMRANYQKLTSKQNLCLIRSGLGFCVTQSIDNLLSVAIKMEQCLVLCPNPNVSDFSRDDAMEVQHAVDVLNECVAAVLARDRMLIGNQALMNKFNFIESQFHFMMSCIALSLQGRRYAEADSCVQDLIKTLRSYSLLEHLSIAKLAGEALIETIKFFFGAAASEHKTVQKLKEFSKVDIVEVNFGTANYHYMMLRVFLRTLANIITYNRPLGARCKSSGMFTKGVFVTVLKQLIVLFKKEKNSTDSTLTTEDRKQFQVTTCTALLSLVSDQVGFGHTNIEPMAPKIIDMTPICNNKTTQLGFCTAVNHVSFAFHKDKKYSSAIEVGKLCFNYYPDKKTMTKGEIYKIIQHVMLVANAYYSLKQYEEGLDWLLKVLQEIPDILDQVSPAFDSFTCISWYDWSGAWLRMKKEIKEDSRYREMTTISLASSPFPDPVRVLRKELNSYFCSKSVMVDEMIVVGEGLEDHGVHFSDKALGVLGQAIGFFWGNEEQETAATVLVQKALSILDDGVGAALEVEKHSPIVALLCALLNAWHGLCLLKNYQSKADKDLKSVQNLDMKAHPEKYKGYDAKSRIIPGISSFTIYHEERVADMFIKSIDLLWSLIHLNESHVRQWIEHIGAALLQVTVKLLAHRVAVLGDTFNSMRIWYIAFMLGKWYNLRRLIILSGSELLRLIPCPNSNIVNTLNETCLNVRQNWPDNDLAKSQLLRVDLAKSISCLKQRNYKDGMVHLKKVLDFRNNMDTLDTSSHLACEADFLLAQYKSLEDSHRVPIILGHAHKNLKRMSPSSLAVKACKSLTVLSRSSNVHSTGWQDLAHNFHILQTIMETYPVAIEFLKTAGKARDARVFGADCIYFAQQMCLMSSTIQMLLPIIEIEFQLRNFEASQAKIECILKILKSYKADDEKDAPDPTPRGINIHRHLRSIGINAEKEDLKKLTFEWKLPDIILPPRHYGHAGKLDPVRQTDNWFPLQKIVVPDYLLHSLDCACYLCRHPKIGVWTIKFLHLQAQYCCYAKTIKPSLSIMHCAKYYLQRAVARSVSQTMIMAELMNPIMQPSIFKSTMNSIHSLCLHELGFHWVLTLMQITPFEDIEMVCRLYKFLEEAMERFDPIDANSPLIPMEMLAAALFAYMCWTKQIVIRGAHFRDTFRVFTKICPALTVKEVASQSTSQEILLATPPDQQTSRPVVCVGPPRRTRRVLKQNDKK